MSSSIAGALRNCSPTRLPLISGKEKWTPTDTHRAIVLALSVAVGLSSGSNYVYSAYAPQLATRLVITSTQANLVGTAGNLGVYLTGPLWGKFVDSNGQRGPLLCGGTLCFIGYLGVKAFYDGAISAHGSPARMGLLMVCMFLTGMGGCAGLTASVNTAAKSFPDTSRATATGTVLAGFGLSAFLFSSIGHLLFKGNAGGLLLLLAIGTSTPMLIGSFFVRPVPPSTTTDYGPIQDRDSLELARTPSAEIKSVEINYGPTDLFRLTDFYILFVVLSLLCGTGLMYINNVGTVALSLTRKGAFEYDGELVSAWQAKQVATISIWNCAGRILGGVFSDFCKAKWKIQRVSYAKAELRKIWSLPVVAGLFVASQLAALGTLSVEHLWMVSTLLGLSYGALFNVVPMLVLEWFGMPHFSQNYGVTAVSPILGGNVLNLVFGRVYDSNTVGRIGGVPDIPLGREHDWENCYASAFKISAFSCFLGLLMSVWAGIRRERVEKLEKDQAEIDY